MAKGKGKAPMSMDTPDCDFDSDRNVRSRKNDAWWDLPTIGTLVELMYVHFQNGQLLSSTFIDQIWGEIAKEMQVKTRIEFIVPQLKGKSSRLRALWRKFHDLITNKSGFGWDPLTCTVVAPKEHWDSFIAANPRERGLQKRGLPHYNLCTEMFTNSTASDSLARSSTMEPSDSDEDSEFDGFRGTNMSPTPNLGGTNPIFTTNERSMNSGGQKGAEKRKAQSARSSKIDRALEAWTSVNRAKVQKQNSRCSNCVENCMAALQAMDGLPRRLFFKAQDALMSKTRRRMFLCMSDEDKRLWVESLGDS